MATEEEQTAKDLASEAGQTAKDLAAEAGHTAKDLAGKAGQTAKDLASEAGRTAKDLAEEAALTARELAAGAEGIQAAVVLSFVNENRRFRRQSRLQTIAILVLGLILAVNTWNTFQNRQVLDKVDDTLAGVNELTGYVARTTGPEQVENTKKLYTAIFKTQEDVAKTLTIVCSVADPLRKVACEQAGVTNAVTNADGSTSSSGVPTSPPASATPAEPAVTG